MELMVANRGKGHTRNTEHVSQPKITRLTEDIEKIVGWITKSDMSCRVGIVGQGGLGKTTITHKIFIDEDVVAHYDNKIWISVSKATGPEDIWRCILEQYGSRDFADVNNAKLKFQDCLNNKKTLLVMDDVWRMDYDWWKDISQFLLELENGKYSIIITTRLENVAREMGATLFHEARKLDENESWSLFYRTVFPLKQFIELGREVETVGREIVDKCDGVPLAIKIIAGLLSEKTQSSVCWKEMSKDFCQELENSTPVSASLQVSYSDLPAMLKPCFHSFSIYPEDAKISAEQLVYWWVGEGFCHESGNNTAIEVGYQSLSELVKRCLVDVVEKTGFDRRVYTCKMHDMVRQFVIKMSKMAKFSRFDGGNRQILDVNSQHLGYTKETDVTSLNGKSTLSALLLAENCSFSYQDTGLATCNTIQVLDLSKMKTDNIRSMELLGWIKSQKLLAYLNLQRVGDLKKLPGWIRRRQNLQILVVKDCKNLKRLPVSLAKLQNLVVLDAEKCPLVTFPTGLKTLSKLQVLSGFKLKTKGKDDASLYELMSLSELRTLNITIRTDDQIVCDEDDVNFLVKLIQVKSLSLEIEGGISARVLEKLVPPPSIQELYLKSFCGDTAPKWITPHLLPELRYLYIGNGDIRNFGSSFWDRSRKSWKITSLCLEHLGSFELSFKNLQSSLEDLSYVEVTDCQRLQSFPIDVCRSGVWEKEIEQNSTDAPSNISAEELYEIQGTSQDITEREELHEIQEMSRDITNWLEPHMSQDSRKLAEELHEIQEMSQGITKWTEELYGNRVMSQDSTKRSEGLHEIQEMSDDITNFGQELHVIQEMSQDGRKWDDELHEIQEMSQDSTKRTESRKEVSPELVGKTFAQKAFNIVKEREKMKEIKKRNKDLSFCALSSLVPMEFLAPLGSGIRYLIFYEKINKDLLRKLDDLSKLEADIDEKVNASKKKGDTISQVVNQWLEKANVILNDESKVENNEINSCFKGGCGARHSLGKKASKTIDDITELLNAPDKWPYFATPVPLQDIEMPTIKDFEAFESTEIAMGKVMKHLRTYQDSIIGVHGMGGIGKTTLMKKIGSQVRATKLFDVVILVSVSQNQDLKKIQSEIAGELSLDFGQEGVVGRAKRLTSRLKQEKSVLIILDDIWMRLDLADVGIPWGDDHKGCKVVLTTRRKEVCTTMATHADVELECLSDQDAWKLFRANAGKEVDDPSLNALAKKVAKECEGLPLALVTLGRAMRGKEQRMWEDVHQLMESDFRLIRDMYAKVFKAIKLSYDYLPDDDTKQIFMFCCLFTEDHKIRMDELLGYTIDEGIIKESNIHRSKRRLHTVISHLTSSHLLQKGEKGDIVTIHDVIRDVAINIATGDGHGFIVMAGKAREAWPGKEMLRECKRLSLMGNELSELPDHPDCPNLLTLALSGCDSLKHMPESFFKGMISLVNLDISHTPISSLPSSITCLENLQTICLDGCSELRDASLIGKLTTLEVISLEKTSIETLPLNEIANFPNMKLLSKEN